MTDRKLHIVSFDYPYPPNYGGVIDVYHKIKAIARQGIAIHLHCFIKGSPPFENDPADDLKAYCQEVHLYPRITHWRKAITTEPYIMKSRQSDALMHRLKAVDAPVLLEGMHSLSAIKGNIFEQRRVVLRMHNIEWDYYDGLSEASDSWWKKAYFTIEAYRLKLQAGQLAKADRILAISKSDQQSLKPYHSRIEWLPPFHGHQQVAKPQEAGTYALYHGNMMVEENRRAAAYLMDEVFTDLPFPLVIAGQSPPEDWFNKYSDRADFRGDLSAEAMEAIIRGAGCHVLPTFQPTGVKLKLLHALYSGRPCIVNSDMVQGTGLDELCEIADSAKAMQEAIRYSMQRNHILDADVRSETLEAHYNDDSNAKRLVTWLFED